jgi:hypothetical protein
MIEAIRSFQKPKSIEKRNYNNPTEQKKGKGRAPRKAKDILS